MSTFTCAHCLQDLPEDQRHIYVVPHTYETYPSTWCEDCRTQVRREEPNREIVLAMKVIAAAKEPDAE